MNRYAPFICFKGREASGNKKLILLTVYMTFANIII